MYDQLNNAISTHLSLTPDDFNLIQSSFRYKTVEKGVPILEIGQRAEEVFFINSGYLRYYKVLESGEELIIHLYAPNSFATSLNSFFLGGKSTEALEAITACELLSITKPDLDRLFSTNQAMAVFRAKSDGGFPDRKRGKNH